jgi:hypothetical protein
MPLRLFGGQGSGKVRVCPACEREIAADATFCPSCYMVIRPEGAAALREYLRGGRVPADVYLLRKMQTEDPNTGPVVRVAGDAPASAPAVESSARPPELPTPSDPLSAQAQDPVAHSVPSAPEPHVTTSTPTTDIAGLPQPDTEVRPRPRAWTGVYSLLKFDPPLPPPALSVEDTPALLAWMLERDPLIPNNIELLEIIHAAVYRNGPAAQLGYTHHVLLQIADDLLLHPAQETLGKHLGLMASAYRRAAGAYHAAADKAQEETYPALWQMASMASRLRVEAWVYRTRYGVPPEITRPRRPRTQRVHEA